MKKYILILVILSITLTLFSDVVGIGKSRALFWKGNAESYWVDTTKLKPYEGMQPLTKSITLEAWAKNEQFYTLNTLISRFRYYSSTKASGLNLMLNEYGGATNYDYYNYPRTYYGNDSVVNGYTSISYYNSATAMKHHGLRHVSVVFDCINESIFIYSDTLRNAYKTNGNIRDSLVLYYVIGAWYAHTATSYYARGEMPILRIYHKALSWAEIKQNHYVGLKTTGIVTESLKVFYKTDSLIYFSSNLDTLYDLSGNGINGIKVGGRQDPDTVGRHFIFHGQR